MIETDVQPTERLIVEAATEVFFEKGLRGATVRDIAARAGVNVSMINYYFRSKEKLFDVVFDQKFGELFAHFGQVVESNRPFFEQIEQIVAGYADILKKNPKLPGFVHGELALDPERIVGRVCGNPHFRSLIEQIGKRIEEAAAAGIIRPILPIDLILNVVSLCVFPFMARPMVEQIGHQAGWEFDAWMDERMKGVAQFVIDAIKI